jgi:uroporphyrinogen decarboxylase
MDRREIIKKVLDGDRPPFVPWHITFSRETREKLAGHYGTEDIDEAVGNHLLRLGSTLGFFEELGNNLHRDLWGVIWDRTVDKNFGSIAEYPLKKPSLRGYQCPFRPDPRFFSDIEEQIVRYGDRFRVFNMGLSLFERAWSLRGMENLLMDFLDHPAFIDTLFRAIADCNIQLMRRAFEYDIDAVYLMDDWGQQHGLLMGPALWRKHVLPVIRRMYRFVRDAGKYVLIHSCGDVDELFEDLIEAGSHCFNPFQPEVMDVHRLLPQYRGRITFYGGISTQRLLPFGTPDEVRRETARMLTLGRDGGYICAPAQSIENDVPLANILALIETTRSKSEL